MKHTYGSKIASIPNSLERLLDLYDEGQLPPDDIIEMCHTIDMDLDTISHSINNYATIALLRVCAMM